MFRNTADVYEMIYEASGKDYAAESSVIRDCITERNDAATSVLDVACGTGGHLYYLREWYQMVGIDIDRGMLHEARRRLPDIELVEADMRTFRLERQFDAVLCLFSSIGYMRSQADLDAAVGNMVEHLKPGGILVIDGWVRPDAWFDGGSTHVETAETPDLKVAHVGRARREGSTTHLEMHHLIATKEDIEHIVENHELTLFEPAQYVAAFTRAGLTAEVLESPMPGRDRYLGVKPR